MSLLEDVFLQDEAGEAQELERIIEGDEYDERQRQSSDSDENSEKEDEATEDKRRVDPASTKTKRVAKNPRFVLNPARLTGPRGISVIPEHFKDFKFKGKGHEKEDLDLVLKKLEHWAYRLYPKFKFEDCLKKIETLGKKRVVSVHLQKIRSDQLITEDTVVQKDSSDEEELAAPLPEDDEFDKLLQQQIDLARATPGHGESRSDFGTPASLNKRSPLTTIMPKATSSPSISDEQRERMIKNRKLAEERRLARLKLASSTADGNILPTVDLTNSNTNRSQLPTVIDEVEEVLNVSNEKRAKKNRSNVIDSSDDDDKTINEAVTVDIHETDKNNMIDLTHQTQINTTAAGSAGKEKDTGSAELIKITDDGTINLTGDFENPKCINEKIIDLIEVQGPNTNFSGSNTNNVENMEIQNDCDVNVSAHQPESITENVIDLTNIQAGNSGIRVNESNLTEKGNQNNIDVSSEDDDDDNILVINEAIVVDIHKGNTDNISQETNTRNEKNDVRTDAEENELDNHEQPLNIIDESDDICEVGDTKSSVDANGSSEIEIAASVHNTEKSEAVIDSEIHDNITPLIIDTKSQDFNEECETEIVDTSKAANNDKNEEVEKSENKGNVEDVLDDLMDVDFSDDF